MFVGLSLLDANLLLVAGIGVTVIAIEFLPEFLIRCSGEPVLLHFRSVLEEVCKRVLPPHFDMVDYALEVFSFENLFRQF